MATEKTIRRNKLAKLVAIEGYGGLTEMLLAVGYNPACPAICMTDGCDFTCEMEPDQDRGWCEECGKNTMKSLLVLAGAI